MSMKVLPASLSNIQSQFASQTVQYGSVINVFIEELSPKNVQVFKDFSSKKWLTQFEEYMAHKGLTSRPTDSLQEQLIKSSMRQEHSNNMVSPYRILLEMKNLNILEIKKAQQAIDERESSLRQSLIMRLKESRELEPDLAKTTEQWIAEFNENNLDFPNLSAKEKRNTVLEYLSGKRDLLSLVYGYEAQQNIDSAMDRLTNF